jgi:hypothetical protein
MTFDRDFREKVELGQDRRNPRNLSNPGMENRFAGPGPLPEVRPEPGDIPATLNRLAFRFLIPILGSGKEG